MDLVDVLNRNHSLKLAQMQGASIEHGVDALLKIRRSRTDSPLLVLGTNTPFSSRRVDQLSNAVMKSWCLRKAARTRPEVESGAVSRAAIVFCASSAPAPNCCYARQPP